MTMNHTAVAIREAADRGGYGYRWWKANDIEDGVGYNALPMRALTEHLYDPAFWKALGKARSWQDTRVAFARPDFRAEVTRD
jgi:hypothetical protein